MYANALFGLSFVLAFASWWVIKAEPASQDLASHYDSSTCEGRPPAG
ncbi:MAG: hypothetical protein ACRDPK_06570 [Carbonactinosporaceae bacterium]